MDIDLAQYYKPKRKQVEAHKCRAKYILFGGAMGGGKTTFLCAEAIKQAMKYPGNRLAIVRKELSVLRRTTMVSFFSICPNESIQTFNQTSLEVKFINVSSLTFLDPNTAKDPLLQKLKGLEIGWFGIDEANEVSIEVYKILKTRLRWILPSGEKPSYEGRLTSNPEPCSLKEKLYIICSGFFKSTTMGNVAVPSYCWEIVQSVSTKEVLFCGWFSNTTNATLEEISVSELEKRL